MGLRLEIREYLHAPKVEAYKPTGFHVGLRWLLLDGCNWVM